MKLKRIHYKGGLTQDRFLENGGGHRKPTLLRVKALLGDENAAQPRTFGIVLETEPSANVDIVPHGRQPVLIMLTGGKKEE